MKDELFEFRKNALLGNISGEPLCEHYKQAWRLCGNDKEMLVKLALMQQSSPFFSHACYRKLGLSKEYILKNFAEFINGRRTFEDIEGASGYTYQLYVGYDDDFDISADVTSIMWCNSSIVIPKTKCPTLYISNYSDAHVVLDGYNSPRIYLFDESKVTIDDCDKTSEVLVYKYDSRADVVLGKFCLGSVQIFNKTLRL